MRAYNRRDVNTLNTMLAPYLGITPEAKKKPAFDPDILERMQGIVKKELMRAFGPSWKKPDLDKEGLISEAITQWVEQYGWSELPTPDKLHPIVLGIRRSRQDIRREAKVESFERQDLSHLSPTAGTVGADVLREQQEEEREQELRLGTIAQYLNRLKKGSMADQFRATIIQLHYGDRIASNQPAVLLGNVPQKNLILKHQPGVPSDCPTCRAIARYVRMYGLTAADVSTVVDQFLVDLAQLV